MISTRASITGLVKSSNLFASKLSDLGFDVSASFFSCGPNGGQYYGQSYIELDAERDDIVIYLKMYADGYGDVTTWTEVKRDVMNAINNGDSFQLNNF